MLTSVRHKKGNAIIVKKKFISKAQRLLLELESSFMKGGLTPLAGESANIFIKNESSCPTGSIKDKTALSMIKSHLTVGEINPSSIVVDASAGNFGVSLSWVCNQLGLACNIIYPSWGSEIKAKKIKHWGGEISYFDSDQSKNSFENVLEQLSSQKNIFKMDQTADLANPLAHFIWTGPEIWRQSSGKVTHLFCAIGTGGTISGVGKYMKQMNPQVQIIGVDVLGSIYGPLYENRMSTYQPPEKKFRVEGVGDTRVSKVFDPSVVDKVIQVDEDEVIQSWISLNEQKNNVGMSTGLVYRGYQKYFMENSHRTTDFIVLLGPDDLSNYDINKYKET